MTFTGSYFTQPTSPYSKFEERATIDVNGVYYSDWETVWLRDQVEVPYAEFRFTCAEREPIPPPEPGPIPWAKLQLKPRDNVVIYLANIRALTGTIIVRQVAYDANNHGVSLQGIGSSWFAARASIIPPDTKFEHMSLREITEKVLKPTGVKPEFVGNISEKKFEPYVVAQPGETIFSFLERLAKDRNVLVGSTTDGHWLMIGEQSGRPTGDLVEGFNILSAQIVISDEAARDWFWAEGQKIADDQENMANASEQMAKAAGLLNRYSPLFVPLEHPVKDLTEVQLRADHEAMWGNGEEITATIVVNGWFNPRTGDLWRARQLVTVNTPMGMLKDKVMGVRSVTYEQDRERGSRTTLDLVNPERLKYTGFQMTPKATSPAGPNQAAPAQPVPDSPPETLPDDQFTHSGIVFP